jgi:hypothetical protein
MSLRIPLIENLFRIVKTIIVLNKYFGKVLKTAAGQHFWLHHRISLSLKSVIEG